MYVGLRSLRSQAKAYALLVWLVIRYNLWTLWPLKFLCPTVKIKRVTTQNKTLCLSALVLSKLYRMVRTFEAQNLGADTVEVLLLYSDNLRQSHHTRDSILVKNSKIPKSIEKKKL